MQTTTSCNNSDLSVYVPTDVNPWNEQKVNHAYRRLCYGATKTEINAALNMSPEALIDSLVDAAIATPADPPNNTSYYSFTDFANAGLDGDEEIRNRSQEIRANMFNNLLNNGLHGRLTLFWSNHFVTRSDSYIGSNFLFEYNNVLQTHALGDFQQFTRDIGITSAMLRYLNGFENASYNNDEISINENYARELYELFTLGENNNYTQQDIVETAKALTGWNHSDSIYEFINFDAISFYNGDKTIFNQTANFDYQGVITNLFQQRATEIALHICTKLYKYFVSPTVNEIIIEAMASIFVIDFNIANVLRILFKSEHFFDQTSIGTQIKSPFDITHNLIKTVGLDVNTQILEGTIYWNRELGQDLFRPVDVAGWQGNQNWINEGLLLTRWQSVLYIGYVAFPEQQETFKTFGIEASNNSTDPYFITKSIIDRFLPKELHFTADYEVATAVFKYNVPQNYYDTNQWSFDYPNSATQVWQLLKHLIKMPEFQIK